MAQNITSAKKGIPPKNFFVNNKWGRQ